MRRADLDVADGMLQGVAAGTLAVSLLWVGFFAKNIENLPSLGEFAGLLLLICGVTLVTLVLIALGSMLVGTLMVYLMARLGWDNAPTGAVAGTACGLALMLAFGGRFDDGSAVFAISSLLGGGVTGTVWGHMRERTRRKVRQSASAPNRIDDPRILR